MDRCAAAYAYHKQGYNCAQSVAGAFADLTGTLKILVNLEQRLLKKLLMNSLILFK